MERLYSTEEMCVVIQWSDQYNNANVRPRNGKFIARAEEQEIIRAGWESLRFGDLIVGDVYEVPNRHNGTIQKYELRNLREPTQEELDLR